MFSHVGDDEQGTVVRLSLLVSHVVRQSVARVLVKKAAPGLPGPMFP